MTAPTGPTQSEQNAYDVMIQTLRDYGLESLGPKLMDFLRQGHTQDQVSVLLQQTDEYKKRFAGNEDRRKAGLPVLSPREYLDVERSYRQIMSAAGLPPNFYDQPEDFSGWIGKDVSPTEIKSRVDEASYAVATLNPATKELWQQWHGVGPSDMTAYFLDQNRHLPELERLSRGVTLGAAVKGTGGTITEDQATRYAGYLGTSGVNPQYMGQLTQQFAQAASSGQFLSGVYQDQYTMDDAAADTLGGDAAAKEKRRRLGKREEAEFGGAGGAGKSSLSQDTSY
ncbi:hypothetical protein [Longispora urticae]